MTDFSASEAAQLMGVSRQAVSRACAEGRIASQKSVGNGGIQYRIALADLPEPAQVRYWAGQLKAMPMTERRDYLDAQLLPDGLARKVTQIVAVPRKSGSAAPEPWTHEEFEQKTVWFNKLPIPAQEEAIRRAQLLWEFEDMLPPLGMTKTEYSHAWAEEHGTKRATLYDWRRMVGHLPRHQWCYGLVPEKRKGNMPGAPKADIAPDLWAYISQSWLTQSKPALRPIYRRAVKMANERDLDLPSEKTIARRLAKLPLSVITLARGGESALDGMHPPRRRDYTTLAVHEIWNSDGRMADVHVRWPDGYVCRPIVVAWLELRTRTVVGWAIGKSESAYLVRMALANGLERARAIPSSAYLDNGRAFASKELTGGQATRYRFSVKPGEMQGTLTMAGVKVLWAKPYNGKAKPIESFWNTLAEAEKRPEFVGAYCGNKPDNRPDEHDVKNAVDVALYENLLREELDAYHDRSHRGDGMNKRSPNRVYAELMPDAVVSQPTTDQIRRCRMAAQPVKLNRSGEVNLLGNRYGNDATAGMVRGDYTAYYDPSDASAPIELWDGGELVAVVPLLAKTGFADREAAQDHARELNAFKRATREQEKALRGMTRAADWTTPRKPEAAPDEPLPRAKVGKLVRLGKGAMTEEAKQDIPAKWLANRDAKLAAMAQEDFYPMPRRAGGMG